MKSILFVSLMNGVAWGGSEELWYQSALYAAKNGYKVGCAFYDWPQKQERIQRLREAGCELYLLANRGREKRNLWERIRYKINKWQVRRYAASLFVGEYDATVINLGYLEIASKYWRRFFRHAKNYTLLFHVHSDNDPIKKAQKPWLRKWVEGARHNLFASERTQLFFEKEFGAAIPRAGLLLNPISFAHPGEPTPYPPLQNGRYVWAMLASLDLRRKAQDNLIRALSSQKWKDRNWVLNLYGSGGSEQKLRTLIVENGLTEKVALKGHTNDAKAALREAHLLLQLTHIDAMPLAVIEALAMARPLAVSDVGDMPKWVREDLNGWISRDASVEAIEQTMEKAWQARERWEEMGKASFRLFREKFPASPEAYFLDQLAH